MSTATTMARPTHKVLPLLRSEVSRISHRRLLRVLALLFLAGIIVVSTVVFFTHRSTAGSTTAELQQNQAAEQLFWEQCTAGRDPLQAQRRCGPEPSQQPLQQFDRGGDKQYRGKEALPIALMATVITAAAIAFIVGASSGGAEWSSRSMTLQLLWEPRRLRLLTIKWLGLLVVTVALAALAAALALGLAAASASTRGTWDSQVPREFGDRPLEQLLLLMAGRGLIFVAVAATVGYAIAMLVRNTGASLGVAFIYFVLVENAVRIALIKYAPEPYLLSTNSVAFLIPTGLDVPGRETSSVGPGGVFSETVNVHLTNARALATMLLYTALLALPAAWSFTRRDVG